MAMTYSTLTGAKSVTGSIRSWQNYDKVDAEGVLIDAQTMIYQTLRVREMRSSGTVSVLAGAESAAIPTGFLDPISLRNITLDHKLTPSIEQDVEDWRTYSNGVLTSGEPHRFAIYDEAFQFECKSTAAWTGRAVFFKLPAMLDTDNETNFLTTRYPHILRAMCLAMAADFSKNTEDYARELSRAQGLITDAMAMDELSRRGTEVSSWGV